MIALCPSPRRLPSEHALVLCLSLTRALNMAIFYEVYLYLSPLTVSLLTGLPYLFLSWSETSDAVVLRCVALRWAAIMTVACCCW